MKIIQQLIDFKGFLLAGSAVISFSHFVYVLFGYTIPEIVIQFFKEFGTILVMMAVFVFAVAWLLKAKPYKRPHNYLVIAYDVFGNESQIEGLRTNFKTHDVAWSFMKQYKKSYPLYSFAMVSDLPNSEKMTIFKYL
ncbi:MAG TPA: hypothetical protein VLD38_03455 [Nitrosopumilaceae archaeon]|nr:hypothetical protein [Nitrosopumilaceae archaeon]